MPNRLAHESSPYLQQHKNNPVDWYPWGEEALARARAEDKPILLSIGYSACHWCHVMEHESFENPEIAALMNERFINIKVDREERPDLDHVYQNVSQLMTRSGGWPLTVFLTPDLKPYFGGTYFPPEDRYGRPGFKRVVVALAEAYASDRANVAENASKLTSAIRELETQRPDEHVRPDAATLRKICDALLAGIDWHNGGFNGAPKFPSTMALTYLWRYGLVSGFGMAGEAAAHSLLKMAKGGIYDHLGGGFHRYSVDEKWAVPHFEKMLYDNALLLKLYGEVLVTGADGLRAEDRELFTETIAETTRYVLREMKAPEGGFFSTQDADSEGVEGKFFVWNPRALREALSEDEARAFELRFGVTDEGNFEGHGETVLYHAMSVRDVAQKLALTIEETRTRLGRAKEKLFNAREKRTRPGRDEKIIAGWNGLMISGLVWAARALRESSEQGHGALAEEALESALVAMNFARTKMCHGENRLFAVYKDGKSRFNAYLDDYAYLAMAALDLARTMDDASEIETLLAQARAWTDIVRLHFADREGGGFYFTSDDHEQLIQRPRSRFDQAIPSGNSVMAGLFVVLADLLGVEEYEREADELLYRLFPFAIRAPFGMGELACAALLQISGPVTVSGKGAHEACAHPHIFQKVATPEAREHGDRPGWSELLVCHRKTCELPLTDPRDARKLAIKKTVLV